MRLCKYRIPTYVRCRRTYRSNIMSVERCRYNIAVTRRHLLTLVAVWVVGWYIGATDREAVRRKHGTAECRSWRGRERLSDGWTKIIIRRTAYIINT